MEEDAPDQNVQSEPEKRPLSPAESAKNPPSKKVRLSFSGKEFRKQLKTAQKTQALQRFLSLINEDSKQDYIATYLEHGGSAMELLQLLEGEYGASPVVIFDIVNRILLQISVKLQKYQAAAYDACRYLLNTYITLISKMIGLSSSTHERLVTLKLLTTIVTCSVVLAKDVLLHVNFNPANLQLLTKASEGKTEVRHAFIHFITAFLVDGHFSTLSVLLEKKGLMTSIISGLKFDKADVVVLVLTAMKNHILESGSVTKTIKMKTFNTAVVRDIVNLYNWKGEAGIVDQKKKSKVVVVDEIEKSKVSEAVHSFLLVLCTSHKLGVIFKDPMVGLRRGQNQLVLTVLQSLVRPWEHSYAGELVIKICKACPDLVKTVWISLKEFLEPRWTVKWVKAVNFARALLEELQPECVEAYASNLNNSQISQVVTIMTSPLPILKILIPEDQNFDQAATKYHVMSLFLKMAVSIENYLHHLGNIDKDALSTALEKHIEKNFPNIRLVLREWDKPDKESSVSDYLNTALDLLEKYKVLAPKMLDYSDLNLDVKDFFSRVEEVAQGDDLRMLQIKIVKFFMGLESSQLKPKTELFRTLITISMEFYHGSRDVDVLEVLNQLLRNSGFFDGYESEVDFWIDGVFNLKIYDENVAVFLRDLLGKVDEKATDYHKKLFESKGANFSPLVLCLGDYFNGVEPTKSVKKYLSFVLLNVFHCQVESGAFVDAVSNLSYVPENLTRYFLNWNSEEVTTLSKTKGKVLDLFHKFSFEFLESGLEVSNWDIYPNFSLDLLRILIFYLTRLIQGDALKDNHKKNCKIFIDYLISRNLFEDDRYLKVILENSILLQNLTFSSNDFLTTILLAILKGVKPSFLDNYLLELRRRIVSTISKIFRKPQKYQNFVISNELIETLDLDYDHCTKLIEKFINSPNKNFIQVISYCLHRISHLGKGYNLEPLSKETVTELSKFLILVTREDAPNFSLLCSSFHNYLKIFTHNIEDVDSQLFDSLVSTSEFNKDNLALCDFLLDRKPECRSFFEQNLNEICAKRSFILSLLDTVVEQNKNDDAILEKIYTKCESHIAKALQKPHKAGQHFQNRYKSVGILIEKFMKPDGFGTQIQKFEATDLFHVYLLKKIYDKVEKNGKILNNMIMTFIHLLMGVLKQRSSKPVENFNEICEIFCDFLDQIQGEFDTSLSNNESFKSFCKLCLKYGVSGDFVLVKILSKLVELCVTEDDGKLILEMLLSHSQFLDVVLGSSEKDELLILWRTLCIKWPQFMERNHVPVLLSAYNGTNAEKVTLSLLKMYEKNPNQTKFFDFKPFLWGRAAASHYSVRADFQQVLWRQPKMIDVLNNLHLGTIIATITDPTNPNSYDMEYFLPLFSHLLSPENPVTTYKFTKNGALALALVGFRSGKFLRLATCHVLQRFYFHLEAKQSGKENVLWLRFVEAICKGIAVFDDFEINNFVGVFLARTALILAQPNDVMYVPLTQYLAAKDSLDFSTIPELYTFLHSPHVDSQQHKHFILQILRDGLRDEKDFTALLRSMGFKLISELFSSTVCDLQTKVLILKVFEKCCRLDLGVRVLCGSLSFLSQVFSLVLRNVQEEVVLGKLLEILLKVVEVDNDRHRNFVVYLNLVALVDDETYFRCLMNSRSLNVYYHVLMVVVKRFPVFLTAEHMEILLSKSDDQFCKYLVRHGCTFVTDSDFKSEDYLRLLFYNKLRTM